MGVAIMGVTAYQLIRLVLIIALLISAALMATPPNQLPLALRGLLKILHKDANSLGTDPRNLGTDPRNLGTDPKKGVKKWRKGVAFVLILLAMGLAVIK